MRLRSEPAGRNIQQDGRRAAAQGRRAPAVPAQGAAARRRLLHHQPPAMAYVLLSFAQQLTQLSPPLYSFSVRSFFVCPVACVVSPFKSFSVLALLLTGTGVVPFLAAPHASCFLWCLALVFVSPFGLGGLGLGATDPSFMQSAPVSWDRHRSSFSVFAGACSKLMCCCNSAYGFLRIFPPTTIWWFLFSGEKKGSFP